MTTIRSLSLRSLLTAAILATLLFAAIFPHRAFAQVAGDNAVYNSTPAVTFARSFIDASVLGTSSIDICAKLYIALGNLQGTMNYPAGAGVIDARGINANNSTSSGGVMQCGTSGSPVTPWFNGTTFIPNSAVILLPAGTIALSETWIVPNRTRVIGEGAGSNGNSVTTLQATSGMTGSMIQMGTTTATQGTYTCPGSICFAVGIEDLRLDGQAALVTVNGIVNDASQELSYVNRVDLYNIKGIGLLVGTTSGGIAAGVGGNSKAQNSGPYTNIKFENTTSTNVATGTECAQIIGAPTRGIDGLTCTSTSSGANAAIVVDAANNSIEDVTIIGFVDGIVLGANSAGAGATENGDVLVNVAGSPSASLIHVCKAGETGTTNCSTNTSGGSNVVDLSILGVYDTASTTTTILDDQTATSLLASTDGHVGAYILGGSVTVGTGVTAWSRFSTSPRFPTWLTGNGPAGSSSCPTKGSIYSNTSGTSLATTVYVCTGSWTGI